METGIKMSSVVTLSATSNKIHRRVGHIAVKYNNYVIVWGGCEDDQCENEDQYLYRTSSYHPPNEVLLYDVEYELWHLVRTVGEAPPEMCGSTAAVCGDYVYVFGGFNELAETGNVQSLYQLNVLRMEWRQLHPAGLLPLACDKLVSWCHNGAFYLFGGYGPLPDAQAAYTALTFVPGNGVGRPRGWNNQLVRYVPAADSWQWPATSGVTPGPRAAHAATRLGDHVYIFGGRMGSRLNDLHCLRLDTMCWESLKQEQTPLVPQSRSWHSLTPLQPHRLLVYGGFNNSDEPLDDPWLYDVPTGDWSPARHLLEAPAERMWHTAVAATAGEVLIIGGQRNSVLARAPALYATALTVVRTTPRSLLRLCLDVVERRWLKLEQLPQLPQPLLDRVQARLVAGQAAGRNTQSAAAGVGRFPLVRQPSTGGHLTGSR